MCSRSSILFPPTHPVSTLAADETRLRQPLSQPGKCAPRFSHSPAMTVIHLLSASAADLKILYFLFSCVSSSSSSHNGNSYPIRTFPFLLISSTIPLALSFVCFVRGTNFHQHVKRQLLPLSLLSFAFHLVSVPRHLRVPLMLTFHRSGSRGGDGDGSCDLRGGRLSANKVKAKRRGKSINFHSAQTQRCTLHTLARNKNHRADVCIVAVYVSAFASHSAAEERGEGDELHNQEFNAIMAGTTERDVESEKRWQEEDKETEQSGRGSSERMEREKSSVFCCPRLPAGRTV